MASMRLPKKLMSLRHLDKEKLCNLFKKTEVYNEKSVFALESEHLANSEFIKNVQ